MIGLACSDAAQVDEKVDQLGEFYNELDEDVKKIERGILEQLSKQRDTTNQLIRSLEDRLQHSEAKIENLQQKSVKLDARSQPSGANTIDKSALEQQMAAQEVAISITKEQTKQLDTATQLIRSLEDRNQRSEQRFKDVEQDAVDLGARVDQLAGHAIDKSALEQHLTVQKVAHEALSQRLEQLATFRQTASASSDLSTHELVSILTGRLNRGDILHAADIDGLQRALRSAAGSTTLLKTRNGLNPTPSLTDAPARQTTSSTSADDAASRKRPRGRPPRSSLESSMDEEPPLKRPRGRPPKNGYSSRNTSTDSGLSSSTGSNNSNMPDRISVPARRGNPPPATPQTPKQTEHIEAEVAETQVNEPEPRIVTVENAQHIIVAENETEQDPGATEELIVIPPERRSGRKPTATRPFGDVMSWKEAKVHMRSLNQMTTYTLPKGTKGTKGGE